MKRSWIGCGLLLVLLILSIGATWAMVAIHDPIEADLQQAARYVTQGDWENADLLFRQAKENWERRAHFRACFADHTPMEEIDGAFAMLETYRQTREDAAFAAGCRELSVKAAAIGEAHEPTWWNLF